MPAALALAWPTEARASGDYGCQSRLTFARPDLTPCNNMVYLSPGNDTRTNLLLLRPGRWTGRPGALEQAPRPGFSWDEAARWTAGLLPDVGRPGFASGEGSRCRSDEEGSAAYVAALGRDRRLSVEDRRRLIERRRAVRPACDGAGAAIAPAGGFTGAAAEWDRYRLGAAAFYAGDFDSAASAFAALTGSTDPWLAETASYMRARVELNRAQVGLFDRWGYREETDRADPAVLAAAEAGLKRYLAAYPQGRYATSARGLFRRVFWLGRDSGRLAAALSDALAAAPADETALIEEADDKLLGAAARRAIADPLLLATLDLRAMRAPDPDGYGGQNDGALTRAELEAQRPRFARDAELFDLLRATHALHVARQPGEVLRLIPDRARQPAFTDRQFSRQLLRGLALEATGDGLARGFWLEMLPGAAPGPQRLTLELALALHEERHDGLDRVFAPGSAVTNATLRDVLLTNVAGPALLRREARAGGREGRVALHTLLHKGLLRGRPAEFVTDLALVPPGAPVEGYEWIGVGEPPLGLWTRGRTRDEFACPALVETARTLARAPEAIGARLCLGEFVRLNGLDFAQLDTQPPVDELGGTPSRFSGPLFSRGEAYKAAIAAPRATPEQTAYALYRAIQCYAPSGTNDCGGQAVGPDQRRRWFDRLHGEFAQSRWARESRLYW